MNLLLFSIDELLADSTVRLTDRRAEYIRNILKAETGRKIKVGQINGAMGVAEILSVNTEEVVIRPSLERVSPQCPLLNLILALPRPQMCKRIFQTCATFGVTELHLIRTERVEKSYFHSPVLFPANIEHQLLLGLEQGVGTCLPQVIVHRRFGEFLRGALPQLLSPDGVSLLADADARNGLLTVIGSKLSSATPVAVAIGPEGGFIERETAIFEENGFLRFNMGKRIFRVETAVTAVLAQLELLRS